MPNKLAYVAKVPEHSRTLMANLSQGQPLEADDYLFFGAEDWLLCIGYPLAGEHSASRFWQAIEKARKLTGATDFYAMSSSLPPEIQKNIIENDFYYVLPVSSPVPPRLRGPINKLNEQLVFSESKYFTPAHRHLWQEFLSSQQSRMSGRVLELYHKIPGLLARDPEDIFLLDAAMPDGRLVASLLLDFAPANFAAYIIGAHSRKNYIPHATDALFAKMLQKARERNKKFIHLGLGVNEGILRFKLKWGAKKSWPYKLAHWQTAQLSLPEDIKVGKIMASAMLANSGLSKRQLLDQLPTQRPFAMLWQLEKNGRVSWLGGTAHTFCHSFEDSFTRLFNNVERVIFEGPLDAAFLNDVQYAGQHPGQQLGSLAGKLTDSELALLERIVLGPQGFWAKKLNFKRREFDLRPLFDTAPWYAFFTIWNIFLERLGWKESVDLEAWRLATKMGKEVVGMENIQEQLESLESLPVERAVRFFKNCRKWPAHARQNMRAYLNGDLEKMMGSSAEFPTRTEHIVSRRDQRFRERMLPYLEAGNAAVFVGSAHLVNLRHMLVEDGFKIRQSPYGLWPRLHLNYRSRFRPDMKVTW